MVTKYDRLAEIKERLKTNYYRDRLEVPSLLVDEDMEWLVEVIERRRAAGGGAAMSTTGRQERHTEAWRDGWFELEAKNERLRADQRQLDESVRNQAIRETIHKEELKRLRAALEKHHRIGDLGYIKPRSRRCPACQEPLSQT